VCYSRQHASISLLLGKSGYEGLVKRISGIVEVYLRLNREHCSLLLYGIKPRTCLFAVEIDVSKGYPLPKLTPVV